MVFLSTFCRLKSPSFTRSVFVSLSSRGAAFASLADTIRKERDHDTAQGTAMPSDLMALQSEVERHFFVSHEVGEAIVRLKSVHNVSAEVHVEFGTVVY